MRKSLSTNKQEEEDLIQTLEKLEISTISRQNSAQSLSSRSSISPRQLTPQNREQSNDAFEVLLELLLKHMREKFFRQIENFHIGITCNNCDQKHFGDDRYKCYICSDYDLCGKCYEDNETFKAPHQNNHPMIYIQQPLEFSINQSLNKGLSQSQVHLKFIDYKHVNITCDGCKQCPLRGVRIKCDQCIDYDLCYDCFSRDVETNSHKKSHKSLIYLLPQRKNFDIDNEVEFIENASQYGCFGSVRKAKLIPLDKIVACKLIKVDKNSQRSRTLVKSFVNELNAYKELRSSNIIKFFGSSIQEQENSIYLYLFLEYVSLGSLENFLQKNNQNVSYRRRFQILQDVINGLKRMHSKNYIHKDIKPDNILITEQQTAKIGDMGIAIAHEDGQLAYVIAPQQYAAPELITSASKACFSKSVDIFSFGLLMNYVFTTSTHKRQGSQVIFQNKSPYFFGLISQCIQKNPDSRPTIEQIDSAFQNFDNFFWNKISSKSQYGSCNTTSSTTTKFKSVSYESLQETTEDLKIALNQAPVSVSLDATYLGDYASGVFNCNSQTIEINHAVLAVGYYKKGNCILKNSWADDWGQQGYFLLAPNNACGILETGVQITA
ncbi:hypothetical protein ABPG72_008808 [Tetrahymena utriculariae]